MSLHKRALAHPTLCIPFIPSKSPATHYILKSRSLKSHLVDILQYKGPEALCTLLQHNGKPSKLFSKEYIGLPAPQTRSNIQIRKLGTYIGSFRVEKKAKRVTYHIFCNANIDYDIRELQNNIALK